MQTRWVGGWIAILLMVGVVGCSRSVPTGPAPDEQLVEQLREALGGGMIAESDVENGAKDGAASTGTGWATLRGRFVFDAAPPQRRPLTVNKDPSVCAPGAAPVLSQSLLVDSSTRGIANVAIFLRKAPRVHESALPNEETVVFDQRQCIFLSHVFPVMVGQTVAIKNSDPVGHNTNIESLTNMVVPANESMTQKVTKEVSLPLKVNCNIHPWMLAYMLPRENGYVAVSAADGSFEIANLPAGEELEFQVWHESATGPKGSLVMDTAEAKALKWSRKGRFKITLEADQTKDLEWTVPASAFGL